MPPSQGTEVILRRADLFSNPKNASDILPVVYGEHLDTNHRIDTVEIEMNNTYLISDDRIFTVNGVFDSNGNEVDVVQYTVFTNGEFNGVTGLAFVQFDDDEFAEANSPFTVNCIGKRTSPDDTQETTPLIIAPNLRVIENPIEVLIDFLFSKGGFSVNDFDYTTINESIAKLDILNDEIRWVFDVDATIGQWIVDLTFQFFGNSFVTNERKLALVSPSTVDHMSEQDVVAHIYATRDCIDGDDGPRYTVDEANIITRVLVNYSYDWGEGEFRSFETFINYRQEEILGQQFEREIDLRGVKSSAIARLTTDRILDKFAEERGTFKIPIRNMKAFGVEFGQLLGFTWLWGPGGKDWRNRIVKVLDVQEGLDNNAQQIIAEETGLAVIDNFNADGSRLADGSSHAKPGPSRRIRQ